MQATTTDLMNKQTIRSMCMAYEDAQKDVREGIRLLAQAKKRLADTVGDRNGSVITGRRHELSDYALNDPVATANELIAGIRRNVWRYVLRQTGVSELCTTRRREELEREIDSDECPELNQNTVWRLLENLNNGLDDMFNEALKEVFKTLTPGACQWDTYKTNEGDAVGSKVILGGYISPDYGGGFRVNYHSWAEQGIQAIDNIFHLLDGKGVSKHPGGLLTAINGAGGKKEQSCETAYFECKWFKKGTLHITFKRLDLVEELNRRAGGMRLRERQAGKHEAIVRASA